jgi:hypothetical protein
LQAKEQSLKKLNNDINHVFRFFLKIFLVSRKAKAKTKEEQASKRVAKEVKGKGRFF